MLLQHNDYHRKMEPKHLFQEQYMRRNDLKSYSVIEALCLNETYDLYFKGLSYPKLY